MKYRFHMKKEDLPKLSAGVGKTAPTRHGHPNTSYEAAAKINVSKCEAEVMQAACVILGDSPREFRWEEVWEHIKTYRSNASDSGVRARIAGLVRKGTLQVGSKVQNERGNLTRTFEVV